MIPKDFITEWRATAPWVEDYFVEQDLIISRALVEIFSRPELSQALAFRGGTALYKLHLHPPARYSEDIDLVQRQAVPIGTTLDALHMVLDPWLGKPQWKHNEGRVTLTYRFMSEGASQIPMRLKVEINSREHFSVFGIVLHRFAVASNWFAGSAEIPTYSLDELMGTKLRALYQRKKGRDLFDIWLALQQPGVDPRRIVKSFTRYLQAEGHGVSRAEFEMNLAEKRLNPRFIDDLRPLLAHGHDFDSDAAFGAVEALIAHLPGEPWRRPS